MTRPIRLLAVALVLTGATLLAACGSSAPAKSDQKTTTTETMTEDKDGSMTSTTEAMSDEGKDGSMTSTTEAMSDEDKSGSMTDDTMMEEDKDGSMTSTTMSDGGDSMSDDTMQGN